MTSKTKQKRFALGSVTNAKSPKFDVTEVMDDLAASDAEALELEEMQREESEPYDQMVEENTVPEEDQAITQEVVETLDEVRTRKVAKVDALLKAHGADPETGNSLSGVEFTGEVQEHEPEVHIISDTEAPAKPKKKKGKKKDKKKVSQEAPVEETPVEPAPAKPSLLSRVTGWFGKLWRETYEANRQIAKSQPVKTGIEAGRKAAKRTLGFLAALPGYLLMACFAAMAFVDVIGIALLDSALGATAVLIALVGGLVIGNPLMAGLAFVLCIGAVGLHFRRWMRERQADQS